VGNQGHVFVIAGLTSDILDRVPIAQSDQLLDGLIPSGCQIIPYDALFEVFAGTVPRRVLVLTPPSLPYPSSTDSLIVRMECDWLDFVDHP